MSATMTIHHEAATSDTTAHVDWPKPLAQEAFHGVAGLIVDKLGPHTEADPAALLIQILAMFGNAIGSNPHYRVEDDKHRGNLDVVLVGQSSRSRKGTSEGRIQRLFDYAVPDWSKNCIASGLSSGEGLIWSVRDPIGDDAGIKDKRLIVSESEFASTLKVLSREGNTLSPVIRKAWDCGDLRILTKNSPAKATGAHVTILAHITREELLQSLNTTEMANGFANRILWVCVRRSKLLPDGGNFHAEEHADLYVPLQVVIEKAQQISEVRRSSKARALWRELYPVLTRDTPGLLGAITSRAEAQVTRLSLLYALLDLSEQIEQEHLLAALSVWEYCEASARCIFGDSLGYPDADTIVRNLRSSAHHGLTRTDINNLFKRNRSEAQIDDALNYLQQRGLAIPSAERGRQGRPAERWRAV